LIEDVKRALDIVHRFVIWEPLGPFGELGSFRAIRVTYDDSTKVWTVICDFNKRGTTYRARVTVDATTEKIRHYELIEGVK